MFKDITLNLPEMKYYSQYGQDEYVHKQFFHDLCDGTFVDVGAHDGVTINNTLFFEETLGWKGINIEPIPAVFESLKVNRPNCINLNCAISNEDSEQPFLLAIGYAEMLSGLVNTYDPRHYQRLEIENHIHSGQKEIIQVKTRKLETILDEHSIKRIHYLTIDTEGAEFEVLKSINFDKVFIDLIQFEDNYSDIGAQIVEYLKTKRYKVVKGGGDIFMIHEDSPYAKRVPES
jgi:FkbM family methyltransferase